MLKRAEHTDEDSAPVTTANKREKFVQLAESRTINAIKAIRVIGKLRQ